MKDLMGRAIWGLLLPENSRFTNQKLLSQN